MEHLSDMEDRLITIARQIGAFVMAFMFEIETWLRLRLQDYGFTHATQTTIILSAAILLAIGMFRILSGLVRIGLIIFMILLVIDVLMPFIMR